MAKKLFGQDGHKGGRTPGAINKTNRLIKEVFADVFNELQTDPKVSLKTWAKQNPGEFYKLGIRLVPTQVNVNANVSVTDQDVIFE